MTIMATDIERERYIAELEHKMNEHKLNYT